MRATATTILIYLSTSLFAQDSESHIVKNIDYYNSLKWKNSGSLEIYIDKTYRLPGEAAKNSKSWSNGATVPYRYWYPYNYAYNEAYCNNVFNRIGYSNVYYTNGFNMGYNAVYYTPIRFGHRHGRHHR
jgi:hypothetical protein